MYSVSATVEGVTMWLHDDTVSNSSVKLIDPVLTLEDSNAGSFTFKLAPNNIGYTEVTVEKEMVATVDPATGDTTMETVTTQIDLVSRMRSTIQVYRDGVEIWEGRVLSEDKDFQNLRDIYCEGSMAYLNDVCMPQRKYSDMTNISFLSAILDYYNSKADATRKIYIGTVSAHGGRDTGLQPRVTSYEKCLETINKLVEEFGGHLRIRKVNGVRLLDWLEDYPNTSTQKIKFGSNLLDFTCNWDMSDLCTVLLPIGEVTQQASSSSVGDPVTPASGPTQGKFLYLNDSNPRDVAIKEGYNLGGYRVAIYNFTAADEGKNFYVSCRLHGGLVAYVFKMGLNGTGMTHSYKTAGSENDIQFEDFEDVKVTVPEGVRSIMICGWSTDIPVTLKSEIAPPEDYDRYLTIEDCDTDVDTDGKCWHQKGSIYIGNPELVTKYGWIEKQVQWSSLTHKEELYSSAKAYLQYGQFDKMTIEVSALDLHVLDVDVDAINLLDKVYVTSEPHGISNQAFPVTKIEIPLDRPQDQKFTIGSKTSQTLTSVNNNLDDELLAKIAGIPNMSSTLDAAMRNAANMIAMATNGFISMVDTDDDGEPNELVISDTADPNVCTQCWVFNVNGLGHFKNNPSGGRPYAYPLTYSEEHPQDLTTNMALTMDGSIVANRITTGTLAAIKINGCDATFGGMPNQQGYPSSGTLLVRAGTMPSAGSDPYCTTLRDGGIYFGTIDSSDAVTDFANIRDNKLYEIGPNNWVRGLVITVNGVFALDIDHLWVSTSSGSGRTTYGGMNTTVSFKDGDGNTQNLHFVHGILVEVSTTPAPQEGGNGE